MVDSLSIAGILYTAERRFHCVHFGLTFEWLIYRKQYRSTNFAHQGGNLNEEDKESIEDHRQITSISLQ